jgi:uncharacterized membrane protein YcaP (DUF421 family)
VPELVTLVYRTAILYIVALVVFRLMGKRTLAKMGPFDFAVVIMIGEAVAIGMEDTKTPLVNAIGITVALGVLQYILTWLNVRWRPLEKLTQGTPTRIVFQGHPISKLLRSERVSHDDLMMELRQKDVETRSQVEEAYLEPTGEISVRKSSSSSTTSSSGSSNPNPTTAQADHRSASSSPGHQNDSTARPSAQPQARRSLKSPKKLH